MPNFPIPQTGFMRLRDVLRVFPVSKSSWYLGVSEGRYPAPVKLGARTAAYRASDIAALVDRLSGREDIRHE